MAHNADEPGIGSYRYFAKYSQTGNHQGLLQDHGVKIILLLLIVIAIAVAAVVLLAPGVEATHTSTAFMDDGIDRIVQNGTNTASLSLNISNDDDSSNPINKVTIIPPTDWSLIAMSTPTWNWDGQNYTASAPANRISAGDSHVFSFTLDVTGTSNSGIGNFTIRTFDTNGDIEINYVYLAAIDADATRGYDIGVDVRDYDGNVNEDGVTDTSTTLSSGTNDTITFPTMISNLLMVSRNTNSVHCSWLNPTSPLFTHNIILLNGVNVLNTSNNYYTATGLNENTQYTISITTNLNSTAVTSTTTTCYVVEWFESYVVCP